MIKENQILIELLTGVERWCDLKIKLEEFNTAQTESTIKKTQAGKIFEVFTKYYLQTDPKKTELYKNVWLYDEVSIEIKEKLRLPSIDHGIDILLQDYDNNFHAVQCKFKNDETKSLSWSGDKIANVFALGTNCHRIIVFTNASDTTSVAKAFEEKFEQIAVDELNSIEPEILKGIYDLARGNQPKALTKHKPKEHQVIAIEKVVQHFESNNRGQLILPCGAGKTVTALWIKEKIKSKTTLVLVPSLALLKQIKNDLSLIHI
jgi:predicted helicase